MVIIGVVGVLTLQSARARAREGPSKAIKSLAAERFCILDDTCVDHDGSDYVCVAGNCLPLDGTCRRSSRRREETRERAGGCHSHARALARPPAGRPREVVALEINAAVFGLYLGYLVVYSQISVCIWLFGYLVIW